MSAFFRNPPIKSLDQISAFKCSFVFILNYNRLVPRIPIAYPEGPDGPVSIKVISGKSHGVESPVRPLGGCWYYHVSFKGKGTIFQDIREFRPRKRY